MIKVTSKVKVYEQNGNEIIPQNEVAIDICSHWNRNEFVVISFEGTRLTVTARDLKAAIENATNSARL